MSTHFTPEQLREYLAQLEGGTITKVDATVDEPGEYAITEPWPTLHVETKDGTKLKLEVSMDSEGNGPGFLFIGEDK